MTVTSVENSGTTTRACAQRPRPTTTAPRPLHPPPLQDDESRRQGRGDEQHNPPGMHREGVRSVAQSLSVYWDRRTWDRSRSAFVAQLDDDGGAQHLVEWLVRAIATHAGRTPAERAALALEDAGTSEGLRKVHQVDEQVLMDLAAAQLADRRDTGRYLSRSSWIREAAAAAADDLERRFGQLPPAPAKLPTGPRPRT